MKKYALPSLNLFRTFEAAARHHSFTLAAYVLDNDMLGANALVKFSQGTIPIT